MPSVTQSLQGEAREMVMLRCSVLPLHRLLPRAGARAHVAHCSFPRSVVASILNLAKLILSMIPKILLLVEQIRS